MSWDCPHLDQNICKLNGIDCRPTKGNCVLRGKVEIFSPPKPDEKKNKMKTDTKEKLKISNQ